MPAFLKHAVQKLSSRLERMSIQNRLIAAYLVVMLIPMMIISVYVFNEFYVGNINGLARAREAEMQLEQLSIRNNMESLERMAQLTLSDQSIIAYLAREDEPKTEELIAFNKTTIANLSRLQYNNPTIHSLRVYFDNPRIYEAWPLLLRESRIAGQAWYGGVRQLGVKERWSIFATENDPFITTEQKPTPLVSLFKEANIPLGNHLGIVEVDMLMSDFFPKTFSPIGQANSQMYVVSGDGQVYVNDRNDFAFQTGLTPSKVKEQLQLFAAPDSNRFQFSYGGKPYLCLYSQVELLDARLVQVVSLDSVLSSVQGIRNKIIIANVILMVLLTAATYLINAFILKKLRVLSESMKRVNRGDFEVSIPIKGSGEVGELAHHFRKMLQKIKGLIAEAVKKNAATKEVELKSLRNQIDSHFLYNTLENIKMMAEVERQDKISNALTSLGGLMRYNLNWSGDYIRLKDEIAHIVNYVAIMNIRYNQLIDLRMEIAPKYEEHEVLKMSLQPIVENAVKYGMETGRRRKGIVITISCREDGKTTYIEISDNGGRLSAGKLEEIQRKLAMDDAELDRENGRIPTLRGANNGGSGIGLRNVHQRLQLFYGREYGLAVTCAEGEWTAVTLKIPYLILSGGVAEHAKLIDRR
ncbi:sensor histidine kinase [Paenibacillus rhizovicinus]|uniref:Sensor histidine kinase n=1 Tax=Paenibacillus rhizovicinus TaxID=2704463 RepID=A0A6C0P2K1_9BACL|nr:histidine kinase [Paenibacillus rhizovicinus]QHW32496.1 sensor histidine kinase [Paenibacillus rhizovicinus]